MTSEVTTTIQLPRGGRGWDWTKKLDNTNPNHNFEKNEKAPSRKKRAIKNDGHNKKKREGVLRAHKKAPSGKKRAHSQNKKTRGQRPQFSFQIFGRPHLIYAYSS